MLIMHLSDLHLGKRVNEFSMLDDQRHILQEILRIAAEERPDAVLIAGDVYDKSIPSAEAVQLCDEWICELAKLSEVYVISGNHDSAERLSWGARLMADSGVNLARPYNGSVEPIVRTDEHGEVAFYLLPFVKPAHVRAAWPDDTIESYTDAIDVAIKHMNIDDSRRNVLVTHQFVTGASRSESEEVSVGGADNVDAEVFESFDYVALGHLHGPQNVGSASIRYCGTPLKYSFSEASHEKSVSLIELGAKGSLELRTIPLVPLHDMREIRGSYEELTSRSFYEGSATDDYLRVVLTDEEEILEAMNRLRTIYPNIMRLEYDNKRTRARGQIEVTAAADELSPMELFAQLYETQNAQAPDEEQTAVLAELIEQIWEV